MIKCEVGGVATHLVGVYRGGSPSPQDPKHFITLVRLHGVLDFYDFSIRIAHTHRFYLRILRYPDHATIGYRGFRYHRNK